MKNFFSNKKNLIIFIAVIVIVLIIVGISIFFLLRKKEPIVDMGDILDQQAGQKTEEQLQLHYMIMRNTQWGTDSNSVLNLEAGNILDYDKEKYITCDYETLFDISFIPTYLFNKDELVAILYEADLSAEDNSKISLIHQNLSVNIHYIYENLYRENNKWSSGQERKYDTNLWSNAILNGKLALQSIWNSNTEKVFLLTSNSPYFKFLEKNKEREMSPSITFIVISDEYLRSGKTLNDLIKIEPNNTTLSDYTPSE